MLGFTSAFLTVAFWAEKKWLSKRQGNGWSPGKEQTQLQLNCSPQQLSKPTRFSLVVSLHAKAAATRGQCDHVNLA